jgi:hypothetical protein
MTGPAAISVRLNLFDRMPARTSVRVPPVLLLKLAFLARPSHRFWTRRAASPTLQRLRTSRVVRSRTVATD